MLTQLRWQDLPEQLPSLGIPPVHRRLIPDIVEAAPGGGQPELLGWWLSAEHEHHPIGESRVDDTLSSRKIGIFGQFLQPHFHPIEGFFNEIKVTVIRHACS